MLDRFEYPLGFLASMRGNFTGPKEDQRKALALFESLSIGIEANSRRAVQEWLANIDFDPETLGSAFLVLYQFACGYLERTPEAK